MPGLRDHEPVVIESFGGLWDRGDDESAPSDHFTVADNVQFFNSGVETRDGIDKYQTITGPLTQIVRMYDYVMQTGQSLLVLATGGKIYHCIGSDTVYGPILTIPEMEDFGFVAIDGRAYITPFKTYVNSQGENYELGIQNEFVYVYKGDGSPARKAGGAAPTYDDPTINAGLVAYELPIAGNINAGIHVIAVTFGDGSTDDSTALGPTVLPILYASGEQQAQVDNLPIGGSGLTQRKIWMTKAIDASDFDPDSISTYSMYLAKTVDNMTDTSTTINIKDDDLTTLFAVGTLPNPTSGGITVENAEDAGSTDIGLHIVGVVYETDTGFYTGVGPEVLAVNSFVGNRKVTVKNIPIPTDSSVVKKHLVASRAINSYNGDDTGYQLYFIPGADLDISATEWTGDFFDLDLIDDASHLIDNFSEIPAGVNLNTYHSRMVVVGEYGTVESLTGLPAGVTDNRSVARVSYPGEPEAISKVDGLIIAPLDGNPLTNVQEFRDVLYLFKRTRTFSYSDNQDTPASWQEQVLDQGVGAPVHGIATVLDSGGVNIDFLLIADWSGLMLFNGTYARPEMSWKIEDTWLGMDRNNFRRIQIVNDSLSKKIWMTMPEPNRNKMLHANYADGMNSKDIRWARWIFDAKISCVTLIETKKLVLGALENAV